jgi:hypothetical protein
VRGCSHLSSGAWRRYDTVADDPKQPRRRVPVRSSSSRVQTRSVTPDGSATRTLSAFGWAGYHRYPSTPEAVTAAGLPLRVKRGSPTETAPWATNRQRAESGVEAGLRSRNPGIGAATCLQACVNSVLC